MTKKKHNPNIEMVYTTLLDLQKQIGNLGQELKEDMGTMNGRLGKVEGKQGTLFKLIFIIIAAIIASSLGIFFV